MPKDDRESPSPRSEWEPVRGPISLVLHWHVRPNSERVILRAIGVIAVIVLDDPFLDAKAQERVAELIAQAARKDADREKSNSQ
jgi:hypothetical protein